MRDTAVIAIAQEDTDLESHGKMLAKFGDEGPPFEVVADMGREGAPAFDRTTAYLIDKEGVVRQVFPMLIRSRPSWEAVLGQVDALNAR